MRVRPQKMNFDSMEGELLSRTMSPGVVRVSSSHVSGRVRVLTSRARAVLVSKSCVNFRKTFKEEYIREVVIILSKSLNNTYSGDKFCPNVVFLCVPGFLYVVANVMWAVPLIGPLVTLVTFFFCIYMIYFIIETRIRFREKHNIRHPHGYCCCSCCCDCLSVFFCPVCVLAQMDRTEFEWADADACCACWCRGCCESFSEPPPAWMERHRREEVKRHDVVVVV
uniref:Uncharacterized protein n=1 Tax=Lotharella globosa TaxID=91324 RepID=A0A7S3YLU5_9EUKA